MSLRNRRLTAALARRTAVAAQGFYDPQPGGPITKLIDGYAGGVRDGRTLKAVIPGGSSVPILMPDQLDTQASFDAIQKAGSLFGSAAIVVLDDTTCMVWLAENLLHFYRHESCGKCTPCREGSGWLEKVLYRMAHGYGRPEDLDLILSFGNNVAPGLCCPPRTTTICQLGPSTMSPTVSLNKHWGDEIRARLKTDSEKRGALQVASA